VTAGPPAAPLPADGYARTADRIGGVLHTANDVLLLGGEAVLALEAAATSLAAPGRRVVNAVTSPYGAWFGAWLRRGGAAVTDVRPAEARRPIDPDQVAAAVRTTGAEIVAVVHGEAATGVVNPVERVARIAHDAGAIIVVDAVASVGAHPLDADGWGLDVVAIGPQKALEGPVSLSALAVSPAAWELVAPPTPGAPSVLSLADLRRDWLDTGRGALPGTPDPVAFHHLERALDALDVEGLATRITRHARAARATRDGIRAAGLEPWVVRDADASHLVTTVVVPAGTVVDRLLAETTALDDGLSAGIGEHGARFVRLNHTGPRADRAAVQASLAVLAEALARAGAPVDLDAALSAASSAFEG
jgi:aspartate aminotransferase-like enzyme